MPNITTEQSAESEEAIDVKSGSVITVVQEIWSSMLGLDPVDADRRTSDNEQQKALLGFVHFGGAWQGAISPLFPQTRADGGRWHVRRRANLPHQ